jgi:HEPN domain-containing protein
MNTLMSKQVFVEIEAVEADLAKNNAPLPGRPFETYRRLVNRFGTPGIPFEPFGTELFEQIHNWYLRRYGQAMNPNIKLGEKPILIRGVPYFFRFPVVYGAVNIDIFQHIQNVSPTLLASLSQAEQDEIASAFERGYEEITEIEAVGSCSSNFGREIQNVVSRGLEDISASIGVLKTSGDAHGAIFHAHAATEKFMKASLGVLTKDTLDNIVKNKKEFGGSGHDIQKGLQALERLDSRFSALRAEVSKVHLPDMSIRYKEKTYRIPDAVGVIHGTFRVCAFVGKSVFL